MAIALNEIKKELVNLFRNEDVLSTGTRGVTTQQDTGTFSSDLTYTVATDPTLLKNIRNIDVAGSDLKYGRDFLFDFETGLITFTVSQTGAFIIDYDTGSTDRIFPDYPQANLKLNQFPRIAVDIISSVSNEFGIGASITQSTYSLSIISYSKSQEEVETLTSAIKTVLLENKKDLFFSPFITPTDIGPILISEFGDNKVFQRNQDAQVRFSFDTN